MLVKITTKYASYSLVTFVTHKRFAVLFFLPSCCVSSLVFREGTTSGKLQILIPSKKPHFRYGKKLGQPRYRVILAGK